MGFPSKRVAYLIFVIAFAVRFAAACVLPLERVVFPDSGEYLQISDNIREGKGIILDERSMAKRPPVYPLFLAAHRAVLGEGLLPVQATQAFLGGLSCVLLLLLAGPVFGRSGALVAAGVLAVYPLHVATSAGILIETLLTFLLLAEICLLRKAAVSGRARWAAAAGLTFGVATLLQAGHLLFLVFVLPFVQRAARPRRVAGVLAVYVCAGLLLPLLWTVRNVAVLDRMVPLTTGSGYTLYESFGPGATGGTVGDRMFLPERGDLDEVEYDGLLRDEARDAVGRDPGRALRLAFEKQRRFWNILPNHSEFTSALHVATAAAFAPVLLLFVLALFRLRRAGWDAGWFVAPIFYLALLHAVFLGSIRYRLPVEPFVIGVAAWALADLWEKRKRPGRS